MSRVTKLQKRYRRENEAKRARQQGRSTVRWVPLPHGAREERYYSSLISSNMLAICRAFQLPSTYIP